MSEWWTYTLSDFLLFSPRTYYRLLEIYNAAIWPAQIVAFTAGLAILALRRRGRLVALLVSACWLWVAIAFHLRRYAAINWAAVYFAAAFALEALLLVWTGVVRGRLDFGRGGETGRRVGLGIFVFALAIEPITDVLSGRGWRQVEVFGVAPDPTAIATLGLLLLAAGRARWELLAIPAIWCLISGTTLWAMKSPVAAIPPLAAAVAVGFALAPRVRSR
jgi:hypothetical protein